MGYAEIAETISTADIEGRSSSNGEPTNCPRTGNQNVPFTPKVHSEP